MSAALIAQLAIAALPYVTAGVEDLIKFIEAQRGAAQAAGEWTDEIEASFRAAVFAKTNDPAYAPDKTA